jgi:hypothetical protein
LKLGVDQVPSYDTTLLTKVGIATADIINPTFEVHSNPNFTRADREAIIAQESLETFLAVADVSIGCIPFYPVTLIDALFSNSI